ncbi:MAG: hypothetical protein QOG37_1068 [Mycobacterium sp.]|nr:hypothetical protein [Mycobacterium sp.]
MPHRRKFGGQIEDEDYHEAAAWSESLQDGTGRRRGTSVAGHEAVRNAVRVRCRRHHPYGLRQAERLRAVVDRTAHHHRQAAPASSSEQTPTTTESELINELVGFTSPSGNVGCYISLRSARCDISERNWSPPPRPADCEFDYGQGITLSPGGEASFICAGDTALGGGHPLAYGKSLSAGVLVCDSAESGITCRDTVTGHGFSIAREAYRLF